MRQRTFPTTMRTIFLPIIPALFVLISGCDNTPPVPPPPQSTPTVTVSGLPVETPSIEATPGLTPLTSAQTETVISGLPVTVEALAWSSDSLILATGAGGAAPKEGDDYGVRLWRPDGSAIATLKGHTLEVRSLAWSPDGKMLASGSSDQTLRLWASDGSPIRTIQCNIGTVFAVSWSPDGTLIATGSVKNPTTNTVQVWKPDGTLARTLSTDYSGGKFYNLAWSLDGKYLAGGATDYKVWAADGTELGHTYGSEHGTPAWGMGWSPDSSKFATGNESGDIYVYDTKGEQLANMHALGSVNSIAWSPNGEIIAGSVGLWHPDGTHIVDFSGLGLQITSLAWAPDNKTLAAAAYNNPDVGLYSPDGTPTGRLTGHQDRVTKMAWSPNGKILASASDDRTVRLWHIEPSQ